MALSKEHNGHCSYAAAELSVNKTVAVFASPVSLCPYNEKLKLVQHCHSVIVIINTCAWIWDTTMAA